MVKNCTRYHHGKSHQSNSLHFCLKVHVKGALGSREDARSSGYISKYISFNHKCAGCAALRRALLHDNRFVLFRISERIN